MYKLFFLTSSRLSALQTNGEQAWRKRIGKDEPQEHNNIDAELQQLVGEVKLRDKSKMKGSKDGTRPVSLAERLSNLDEAQEGWKDRVEKKDVTQFTLDEKMSKKGKEAWNLLSVLSF